MWYIVYKKPTYVSQSPILSCAALSSQTLLETKAFRTHSSPLSHVLLTSCTKSICIQIQTNITSIIHTINTHMTVMILCDKESRRSQRTSVINIPIPSAFFVTHILPPNASTPSSPLSHALLSGCSKIIYLQVLTSPHNRHSDHQYTWQYENMW